MRYFNVLPSAASREVAVIVHQWLWSLTPLMSMHACREAAARFASDSRKRLHAMRNMGASPAGVQSATAEVAATAAAAEDQYTADAGAAVDAVGAGSAAAAAAAGGAAPMQDDEAAAVAALLSAASGDMDEMPDAAQTGSQVCHSAHQYYATKPLLSMPSIFETTPSTTKVNVANQTVLDRS